MSADPTVGDWLTALDGLYPPAWAEAWDSTGLQVGDRAAPAARVLVSLDPTREVVEEAVDRGCGLLVAHHPLLFRPAARLDLADPVAAAVATALLAQVAVAACHTNADVASPGVSDVLAEVLDLRVTGPLHGTEAGTRAKLVVFVPSADTAKVLDAVAGAGAGVIGEYTHCSFRVRGTGTFIPSEAARPAIGERGALNEVEEDRLEVVVSREALGGVVSALLEAHPYEEVAYDVYPLAGPTGLGLGRVAAVDDPIRGETLVARCRERLGREPRVAGEPDREVRRVAVCGGAGASLVPDALRAGVDAYVTGDLKHHEAQDAAAGGLLVIDAGHHATEWPFVPHLADSLRGAGPDGEVLVSATSTDPFGGP
jgi:dinuclear metal center YbgI/SA1388 family protein